MDLGKKTYQMSYPKRTHWREVSCHEFKCDQYLMGWTTTLSAGNDQLGWIRFKSGLRFTESTDGLVVKFRFPAGQECFTGRAGQHRIALERDPNFKIDKHQMEFNQWMDDFQENQYQISRRREVKHG
jgi:hypothetical protein